MQNFQFPISNSQRSTRTKILLVSVCIVSFSLISHFSSFISLKAQAATGINDTINFQGKLVNTSGLNVADGTYSVVFSLYSVSSGGTAIWTETQNVTTTDGLFQVHLGETTDLPGSVDFNTDNIYLGIKVGADTEMTPRIQFAAVPYAFNAQKVAGLTVTDTTGTLTIPNGKTIQFGDAFTTTGANALNLTTTGTTSLTLPTTGTLLTNTATSNQTITSTQTSGTILGLSDTTNITAATTGLAVTLSGTGAFDQTGLSFNLSGASGTNTNDIVGSGGSWKVSRDGALTVASCTGCGGSGFGGGYFRLDSGALSPINDTVDLLLGGISSSSAKFKFSPSGTSPTASVSGRTSQAALLVDNQGTGDLFSASASGLNRFVIQNNGNVGIGTSTPNEALHVANGGAIIGAGAIDRLGAALSVRSAKPGDQYVAEFYGTDGSYAGFGVFAETVGAKPFIQFGDGATSAGIPTSDWTINSDDANFYFRPGNIVTAPVLSLASTGGTAASLGLNTGTASHLGTLDVRALSYLSPVASFSGQTGKATLTVDNSGAGDIFTASSSGLNRFVIKQDGNVGIGVTSPTNWASAQGFTNNLTVAGGIQSGIEGERGAVILLPGSGGTDSGGVGFYDAFGNSYGGISADTPGITLDPNGSDVIISNGDLRVANLNAASCDVKADTNGVLSCGTDQTGGGSGGVNYLRLASGAFSLVNDTTDFLFGSNASSSAKFKLSPSGASPTASISGRTGQAALLVDNQGTGDLFAASASGMNRFVIKSNGNVGIGTSNPTAVLHVVGATPPGTTGASATEAMRVIAGSGSSSSTAEGGNGGGFTLTSGNGGNGAFNVVGFNGGNAGNFAFAGGNGGDGAASFDAGGSGGAGGGFSFTGGNGGLGAQLGGVGGNGGSVTLQGGVGGIGDGGAANGSRGNIIMQANGGSVGIGTSSPLATLDIRGTLGTTPFASISGQSSRAGLLVDNNGVGDLFTASKSGATKFTILNNGNLRINNYQGCTALETDSSGNLVCGTDDTGGGGGANYLRLSNGAFSLVNDTADYLYGNVASNAAKFKLSTSGAQATASVSGLTGYSALVVNNSGTGDLLTASKSGASKFTVMNNGSVRINNLNASNCDVKSDTTGQLYCGTDSTSGTSKFLVKGTDENVPSGTTMQSDDDFTFAVGTGETWIITYNLLVTNINNATPDWKAQILGASGWTCNFLMYGEEPANAAFPQAAGTDCDNAPTAMTNATIAADVNIPFQIVIQGRVTTTSTGNITLQWAPNTSGSLTVRAGSYMLAQRVGGSDLAEMYYTKDDTIRPGDVVSMDSSIAAGVKKSSKPYDSEVYGIVSTKPGLIIGDGETNNTDIPVLVALSGRVPVKVTTENGPIKAGDLLTSSSTPGVAMKATKAGQVIGQAMTEFGGDGVGEVAAFIKTDFAQGVKLSNFLDADGSTTDMGKAALEHFISQKSHPQSALDVTELLTDRVTAGLELIAPRVVADKVEVNTIKAATGNDVAVELSDDGQFVLKNASGEAIVKFDAQGNAVFSGTVKAGKFEIAANSGLASLETKTAQQDARITSLENKIATSSSTSTVVSVTSSNSAETAKVVTAESLSVAGAATVSANLRVQGNSLIEGILNVVDTLTVSNIIVNKVANFFADVIFHSDVFFKGTAYFNEDAAGYVTVKKGLDKAEVKFTKPYDKEPVVNASVVTTKIDDDVFKKFIEEGICDKESEKATCEEKVTQKAIADAMPYVIGSRSTDGFTILLSQPAAQDLTFSWSALAVIQAEEISLKGGDR